MENKMDQFPNSFGTKRTDTETLKRDGWRKFGTLIVNASDARLNPSESQFVKEIGERLYGLPAPKKDNRDGR
jgi:hypothetical protein